MTTRTRLVLALLAIHLATSLAAGVLAWWWLDREVGRERQARASAIAQVLAQGGFSLTPRVQGQMEELAGTRFRLVDPVSPAPAGSVRVAVADGREVEVDPPEDGWRRATAASLVAAAIVVAGAAALFALAAWWTARRITGPVEVLALAARRIGGGGLDEPVPVVGVDEVAALAADLEQMRRRLRELGETARRQERLAVLGTFAAVIAHEVRNPLSAIRLAAQLVERERPHPALDLVLGEIERLDLVVDGLLGYARGMTIEPRPCDLAAVADDVLRLLARQAGHAGVRLERRGAGTALADPRRLRQLLLNLVLNGIQAQADGRGPVDGTGAGLVVVEISAGSLAVLDDGPGVPVDLVAGLFTAFTSGRPQGTGLGLHLAWTIAQAHGARLAHAPRRPRGAAFHLTGLAAAP